MDKDFDKEKPSEPDQAAGEFPEPPDPRKVHELREKMNRERRSRSEHKSPAPSRLVDNAARRAKDIGAYTLIPMLMLAGPAVGYVLGLMVQNRWGGEPWVAAVPALLGAP